MCGIAGMLAATDGRPDEQAVRRMCDAMVHRGPDDHGYREDGPCALGHRRLSIIDLRPEGAGGVAHDTRGSGGHASAAVSYDLATHKGPSCGHL